MGLKIQIASDIHAEFWNKKIYKFLKPSADILALLGDTCCVGSNDDFEIYKHFIRELLPKYKHIILISGNHEYYFNSVNKQPTVNNTISACDRKLRKFCNTSTKLHYLNNATMTLKIKKTTYIIIGSTLWSWIPNTQRKRIQSRMNDYKYIYTIDKKTKKVRHITSHDISAFYLKNIRYIKKEINKAKRNTKVIVLTHHKPYLSKDHDPESYSCAYESDASDLFKKPVVCWCYGHTHIKDNSTIKKIKFISNPKGYPNQRTKFTSNYVIDV